MDYFYIPDLLFKEPFNKISSNAKILYSIHLQDELNKERYEDLGVLKKYYNPPQKTSIDEISKMTGLSFQEVHNALCELNKIGLCGGDDFICR